MLRGIFTTGVCIACAMGVVKDGRVLRHVGLTAECVTVQRYLDGSQLRACRAGRIEHAPDLGPRGCVEAGDTKRYEYWRCPNGGSRGLS